MQSEFKFAFASDIYPADTSTTWKIPVENGDDIGKLLEKLEKESKKTDIKDLEIIIVPDDVVKLLRKRKIPEKRIAKIENLKKTDEALNNIPEAHTLVLNDKKDMEGVLDYLSFSERFYLHANGKCERSELKKELEEITFLNSTQECFIYYLLSLPKPTAKDN
ncbi:hypothetical protein COEREDRAFT_89941 [Coemansia reversa NRRL 1564]|uniref:Uncharacterized protein n=1 Tax=Coemansia reversa (strain ATCC 12441 / NRRL 1564) TaxID=763665 RepID=A0A2G5B1T1_COERN|nr:hypothetical protein COEREDRAFT_89941 [Coemansia reversa NRRL 1564]|eukprot:PIA12973.1 hypothetical protein COEREDRAFT_89941 [Coemansia reversa NRRL 1564]